jgi:hypothetical protein
MPKEKDKSVSEKPTSLGSKQYHGLGCNSVIQPLLRVCKVLGSTAPTFSPQKRERKRIASLLVCEKNLSSCTSEAK